MYPVLVKLGPISVNSWGFMLAIAVVVSIIGVGRLFEREGYDREMVLDMVLLMVVMGVIGSRLAYIMVYDWQAFLSNPLILFSLQGGGIAGLIWYGGLVGGFIPFAVYVYRKKLKFWPLMDMFAPYVALGYALVRIGCFLAGCCYGKATSSGLGVVFPYLDHLTRHPTQLYSSFINFVLFGLLLWRYPQRRFSGEIFILYIAGYSVYRFIIEFFRENTIFYGDFTIGQVYTAGLFIIALILYWARRKAGRIEESRE